ncbi:MAG: OmpA family protein, partial [Bacteroidota bacterium]|nr:OmpA family protein [Bacteroidota bacterium]
MKTIKDLLIIMLFVSTLNLKAQSELKVKTFVNDTISFLDNFYIEPAAGTQVLFSKDAGKLSASQRFTPFYAISAGKWFTPSCGLRLQAQGYALNGFSTVEGLYIDDPVSGKVYGNADPVRNYVSIEPDGSYRHYIRYVNLHADFQLSLLNLLKGYKENRRWDVIPSVGLGYMRVIKYKGIPHANIISTSFGLMGKYHLSSKLDINGELGADILPDQFDGRIAGKIYENYCSASIGISYYFKKKGFKRTACPPPPAITFVPVEKKVIVRDTVVVKVPVTVEKTVIPKFNLAAILFDANSDKPLEGQDFNFRNIVEFLNQYPTIKIRLQGYADEQTGTLEYNINLALQRAKSVYDLLLNSYHVNKDRVEIVALGSAEQPYDKTAWNRVVIAVAVE